MKYGVSSRDSLARAVACLEAEGRQHLFYAALELRCGIEARMQEYLSAWEHISAKKKKGWQIQVLGKNIEAEFKTGGKVVRWAIEDDVSGETLVIFYHTPVSRRLQELGSKLGDYLHSLKTSRSDSDPWWDDFRHLLHEATELLRQANVGTLLGPPLAKKGIQSAQMNIELRDEDAGKLLGNALLGRRAKISVSYLDEVPTELEPTAHRWGSTLMHHEGRVAWIHHDASAHPAIDQTYGYGHAIQEADR
ncbi:hypothetical protein [Cupriavidus plantarum]|uniref:hypothetical protein n=1 Tax=Cupriavidus plantarum TaxID=942865 RepID=UPI0015CD7278|nr:hypothetical protein [Cupriavidus plantarum]NYI02785.1 hypothetical protein [Cupriavidus plantarum]